MPVLTDPFGWFTLEVPDGWDMQTEDCVTTLRRPAGQGTVYLSGARHARGPQPGFGGANFLARFLRSLGLDVEDEQIGSGGYPGWRVYSYRRDTDERHWRFWSVTDDETALLISYTCGREEVGAEADEVEEIVRSARLYHSAPVH
ncbi:MAG TPA: hypothetical protein VIG50_05875 [Vicinamibacteria bacterium]|jgi:hypothetical protein